MGQARLLSLSSLGSLRPVQHSPGKPAAR